jgi:O-antigen/teichoic acid export membrane protein
VRASVASYASSVAGSYVLLALSFGTSVYLTRVFDSAGFGRLALVFAMAQTAAIFVGFWTHPASLRYGAEDLASEGSLRRVFWGRMLIGAPPVLASVGLGWALRDDIQAFHGVTDIRYADIALYFLTLFASLMLQVVYQARGRAGTFAFLQSGERGLILVTLVAVHLLAAPTLRLILLVYTGAGVTAALVGGLLIGRQDLFPIGTSWPVVRRLLAFSWPIVFAVVGNYFASNWLDILILRHFAGVEAVGQYTLAYQLMGAVQQIPSVSFPVIVPLLVSAYVAERGHSIQLYLDRVVPHAVFGMVVLLSAGMLLGPPLVTAIFGTSFAAAARALPVLLFAVGWYCLFITYLPILNLHERSRQLLVACVAAAATNVVGDLALVPRWGVMGAAWATVASQAIGAIVVAAMVKRNYPLALRWVMFLLTPLPIIVVAEALGAWGLAAGAVLAAGLLAAAARAQRLCSAPDRRLFAALDLPGLRRLLPAPASGELP